MNVRDEFMRHKFSLGDVFYNSVLRLSFTSCYIHLYLQLVSCLLCKRCPHYFLPNLDLFRGKSPSALEGAAKQVWRLTRELLTNTRAFEKL